MGWPVAAAIGAAAAGQGMQSMSNAKSSLISYGLTKKLIGKTREANEYNYRRRYQWTVEDMREAGLNPILAAQGGFGSVASPAATGAPTVSVPGTSGVDIAGSAKALQDTEVGKREEIRKAEETSKIIQEARAVFVKAEESIQNIAESKARVQKIRQEERNLIKTVFNTQERFWEIAANIDRIDAQISLLKAQEQREQMQAFNIASQTAENWERRKLLAQQGKQLVAQLEKLSKVSEVYKGPIGKVLAYVKEILDGLNVGAGVLINRRGGR